MDTKIKKELIFLLLLFFIGTVSSLEVDINVKEVIYENEMIEFNYSIVSEKDLEVIFFPHYECEDVPIPLMREKEVSLKAGIKYEDSFEDQIVKNFASQECRAYLEFIEPEEEFYEEKFEIESSKRIDFKLILNKKIFEEDEEISFYYESNIDNFLYELILIYPNGETEKITFEDNLELDAGSYKLRGKISKNGYVDYNFEEEFLVREKEKEYSDLESIILEKETEESKNSLRDLVFFIVIVVIFASIIYTLKRIFFKKNL